MSAHETRTERVATAALMVRTFASVTSSQAAKVMQVSVAEVEIALGRWVDLRGLQGRRGRA